MSLKDRSWSLVLVPHQLYGMSKMAAMFSVANGHCDESMDKDLKVPDTTFTHSSCWVIMLIQWDCDIRVTRI